MATSVLAAVVEKVASLTGLTSAQVFVNDAPISTGLPYAIVERVNEESWRHQGGKNTLSDSTVAVECVAASPFLAETLSDAVIAGLDGVHVSIGTSPNVMQVYAAMEARTGFVFSDQHAGGNNKHSERLIFKVLHPAT